MRGRYGGAKPVKEKHAINEQIEAPEVRLVDSDGGQLGLHLIADALRIAGSRGLDLVEVAPQAKPPVCKLLDYGKLKYREQKKAAETRKKSSTSSIKEIRVRYSIDKHDLDTKIRSAKKFLAAGDKVRFQMRFRGREVVYKDLGEDVFKRVAEELDEIAAVEEFSPLVGNRMAMVVGPRAVAAPK